MTYILMFETDRSKFLKMSIPVGFNAESNFDGLPLQILTLMVYLSTLMHYHTLAFPPKHMNQQGMARLTKKSSWSAFKREFHKFEWGFILLIQKFSQIWMCIWSLNVKTKWCKNYLKISQKFDLTCSCLNKHVFLKCSVSGKF